MLTTVNVNQYDLTEIEVLYSMGTNRIKVNPRIKGDEGVLVALVVKNLPASAGNIRDVDLIPQSRRSPGGGESTHSSILAWRIPWIEGPARVRCD